MSFSPSFTVGQSVVSPGSVVFTDDSSGSDSNIVSRRITITDSQGAYVVPPGTTTNYISWALATNPITIASLLQVDTSVNILVQWLDSSNAELYSDNNDYCLEEFNIQNFIYLIQNQGLYPGVVQDTNYFSNLCQYWINIIGADTMIVEAEDLAGSQNCLNRATYMLQNQSKFF
jgi:hypothetical protein